MWNDFSVSLIADIDINQLVLRVHMIQSMGLCHAQAGVCEVTKLSKAYWRRGTSVAVSKASSITSRLTSQSFSK